MRVLTIYTLTYINKPMDIQKMISELFKHGISDVEIARLLSSTDDPITQPTVNRWRRGVHKRVAYSRYIKILNLYNSRISIND